uniref:hypothetical protein n=1 Tax=Streptomyces adelaidensis TaxID=2796465 RepID=UPI001F1611BB
MIAEAADAALLLWQALWPWIVVGAVAATAGVLVAVAVVWGICRMLRRAWTTTGPRRPSMAPLAAEQPTADPESPETAQRPSVAHPRPSWVRTDKD